MTMAPQDGSHGILFVLSAPSGAGKTTVAGRTLAVVEGLRKSVSHTTRKIRPGETDGVDYHFIGEEQFHAMRERGDFVEWAEVYGKYYGTSSVEIKNALARGEDLLLVIDVQGAGHVRAMKNLYSRSIFLLPPNLEELRNRLEKRGTDTPEAIKIRMDSSQKELEQKDQFDHRVVNDGLDKAVDEVRRIIEEERAKRRAGDVPPEPAETTKKSQTMRTILLVLSVTIAALTARSVIKAKYLPPPPVITEVATEAKPDILGPSPMAVAEKAVGTKLDGPYPFFDQDAKPFGLEGWFDKPMVISYVFTECPMVCPTINASLAGFAKAGFLTLGKDYRIVTVGFDNVNDKPAAMKKFGAEFTSDFSHWKFVSGSPEVVKRLSNDIGIMYEPDSESGWRHTMGVTFVAAGGKVTGQLFGMSLDTPDILAKLKEAGAKGD